VAVKWYGYVFSTFFLLYGGVNIILGVLDRDYGQTPTSLVFLIVGIILMSVVVGYRDGRRWGWYGMVAIHGVVAIWCLIGYSQSLNFIFLAGSLGCMALLFTPRIRSENS
jgi:hypothetical protein